MWCLLRIGVPVWNINDDCKQGLPASVAIRVSKSPQAHQKNSRGCHIEADVALWPCLNHRLCLLGGHHKNFELLVTATLKCLCAKGSWRRLSGTYVGQTKFLVELIRKHSFDQFDPRVVAQPVEALALWHSI